MDMADQNESNSQIEDSMDSEIPKALLSSMEESIRQLDRGEGIPHVEVMDSLRREYEQK
jgi:hypothetical protein